MAGSMNRQDGPSPRLWLATLVDKMGRPIYLLENFLWFTLALASQNVRTMRGTKICTYKDALYLAEVLHNFWLAAWNKLSRSYFSNLLSKWLCCFFLFSESEVDCQFSSLPNMAQLVQFISGHPYLPSSGLDITFSPSALYPDADSCFCFLRLPTIHNSYQEFRNAMNTAITCQYRGYGRGWSGKVENEVATLVRWQLP